MPSLHTTCSPACSSARLARLQVASSMLSNLGRAVEQTKPRILVCTPSNAACDELLTRGAAGVRNQPASSLVPTNPHLYTGGDL